ncbi:Metal tolerance protein 9 [Tetrabaena socialis]|uniref:Metal tolerance protein 9 n=1 Tax=Tetrabaena socialis TaxID=47790 RepID=A0A2J8AAU5_9CHLO|nr:Metal tolerance protein 9 [Tetrabaena socialis]|eukprot:PNH09627.1 Metal tolerance protein 9 [Tetrabaena socialis]
MVLATRGPELRHQRQVKIKTKLLLIHRAWQLQRRDGHGQKMIGLGAPEELVAEVRAATEGHHPKMELDRITAYHHGSNVVVEVSVIVPLEMSVGESHGIALALQHKIEGIDSVERAFVHVDFLQREEELHKIFLRAGQMAQLDKIRTDTLNAAAITLQRFARGMLARRRFAAARAAVLALQRAARAWAARRLVAAMRAQRAALTIQKRAGT